MTNQELWDANWQWFIVKGRKRSVGPNGQCLYRGPRGTKCGIGIVIPDDLYRKGMEGMAIEDNCANYPEVSVFLAGVDPTFAVLIQKAHDDARNKEDQKRRLLTLAENYDLTLPEGIS